MVLAKEVATLDRLSQGRVILGDRGRVAGRQEFDALGVPFADRAAGIPTSTSR